MDLKVQKEVVVLAVVVLAAAGKVLVMEFGENLVELGRQEDVAWGIRNPDKLVIPRARMDERLLEVRLNALRLVD